MPTLEETVATLQARIDELEKKGKPTPEARTRRDFGGIERNTKTGEVVKKAKKAKPIQRLTAAGYWADRFDMMTANGRLLIDHGYNDEAIDAFRTRFIETNGDDKPPVMRLSNGLLVDKRGERVTGTSKRPEMVKLDGPRRNRHGYIIEDKDEDDFSEEHYSVASMFEAKAKFRKPQPSRQAAEPRTDYDPMDS